MGFINEEKSLLEEFNRIRTMTTAKEFKQIMIMATQDIMFNKVGFKKLTKEKEVIDICKKCFKLLRKDEIMWIKLCTSCGYSVWSLNYDDECKKCGGKVNCTPTS